MKARSKLLTTIFSVMVIIILSMWVISANVGIDGYEAQKIKLRQVRSTDFDWTDANLEASIEYNPDGRLVYSKIGWWPVSGQKTGVHINVGVPVAVNRVGFNYVSVATSADWQPHTIWDIPIDEETEYRVGTYYMIFPVSFATYGRDENEIDPLTELEVRIMIDLNSWDTIKRDVALGWVRIAEDGATDMDMWHNVDDIGKHQDLALFPWGKDKIATFSLPNGGERLDLFGVGGDDYTASTLQDLADKQTTPLDRLHRSKGIAEFTIPRLSPGVLRSNWDVPGPIGLLVEGERIEIHASFNLIVSFMVSERFFMESGGEASAPPTPEAKFWEDLIEEHFLALVIIVAIAAVIALVLIVKVVLKR